MTTAVGEAQRGAIDDAAAAAGGDVRPTSTAPLDAAAEYVRAHADRVVPLYVVAMAPHAVVTSILIDAAVATRRSLVALLSAYLVACTLWRWVWLARLQYRVQWDVQGWSAGRPFWRRLPAILHLRLWGNFGVTWASVLAGIPGFYGLYVGSFAAPLVLDEPGQPAVTRLRLVLSWVGHAYRRLVRVLLVMAVLALVLTVAVFVGQVVLVGTVLPSLLGVDAADLSVTVASWPWRLRSLYMVFLVLDAFWTVAAVFLYYESQSRRMATDLRTRLNALTAARRDAI